MSEEFSTQSFRDLVVSSLAEFNTNQKYTLERLGSMNESIKELYDRSESNKSAIMTHAATCPVAEIVKGLSVTVSASEASHPNAREVNERVTMLEQTINKQYNELKNLIVEKAGEEKGKDKMLNRWWPLVLVAITAVLSALGGLILAHANVFAP